MAFNYFRLDAHLKNIGETDFTKVSQKLGLDCDSLSGIYKQNCESVVNKGYEYKMIINYPWEIF